MIAQKDPLFKSQKKEKWSCNITATEGPRIEKENEKDRFEVGKYFISFIDVLGFSNLSKKKGNLPYIRSSLNRTFHRIRKFYLSGKENEDFKKQETSNKKTPPDEELIKKILEENFTNFSDLIIFYIRSGDSKSEKIKRLDSICWVSNEFIAKSIIDPDDKSKKSELPLRCGIAYGDLLVDEEKNIHIGKPLEDAHKISECQKWMGGAIHESVCDEYIAPLRGYNDEIYNADIPFKDDSKYDIKNALNWVQHHHTNEDDPRVGYETCRNGPTLRDIGYQIRQHDWGDRDKNIRKKENTLKFVRKIDQAWNEKFGVEKSTEVTEWMRSRWPEEY